MSKRTKAERRGQPRYDSGSRVALVAYLIAWGAALAGLALYAFFASSCAGRVAGDPFAIARPAELREVCHGGVTMLFGDEMAKRHLIWHEGDYPGKCREGT